MKTMKVTHHQVAFVHDESGEIVHTHEIVYHEGAAPVAEAILHSEALAGAKSAHAHTSELKVRTSSLKELDAHRNETIARMASTAFRRSKK